MPYSFLYSAFDPANPLSNILGGNDFFNATQGLTGLTTYLNPNTNYTFVVSNQYSFSSGGGFTAYVQASPPTSAVPESGFAGFAGGPLSELGLCGNAPPPLNVLSPFLASVSERRCSDIPLAHADTRQPVNR